MPHQKFKATILVADDYDDTRSVLSMWLRGRGYQTVEAANGVEAVERAGQAAPDLILMDIEMPVLDGLSATRRIRAQEALRAVPIIALSAYGREQFRPRALAAGRTEYLSVPFAPDELERLIADLAPQAEAVRSGLGHTQCGNG